MSGGHTTCSIEIVSQWREPDVPDSLMLPSVGPILSNSRKQIQMRLPPMRMGGETGAGVACLNGTSGGGRAGSRRAGFGTAARGTAGCDAAVVEGGPKRLADRTSP